MDAVALTRELVTIPSHDDPTACGDRITAWLRDATDATVRRDDAGNVFASRGDPALWFVGHHDVVPPADDQWDGEQFAVEERDGRLYGRGTADMKGSLAAMACAFRDTDAPLGFVSFVGEEQGGVGCRAAIDDGFAPTRAVVGEGSTGYSAPGVTDVAVAHKGRRASTLTVRGTATHASTPDRGDNAVYRGCDVVDALRELDAPETTVFGESLQGTVVVTGIEGGESWNSVPERCELTVDERTVPGERTDLDALADEHVEVDVDQDLPPMQCDDEAFAQRALDAARATQDGDPQLVAKPHATDAGWLAARAGTDCLVVGAAEPGEAHTATESVRIDSIERCYDLYRELADAD